ncbi:unnamed protein product [Prunus brigantina]
MACLPEIKRQYTICPLLGLKVLLVSSNWTALFTYEDLMRYVIYAKEAKLSIYAPDFNSNKTRKKAGFIPRRTRPSSGARRKLLGQSSRPLPLDQGEDSGSLEGSTDPVESTDTGKNIGAGLHEASEDPIRQEAFNE